MIPQYLSLFVSAFAFFVIVLLIHFGKRQKQLYISFAIPFLAEVIYYIYVLYGDRTGSHDVSAMLRIFQTIMFSGPFILEFFEEMYIQYNLYKVKKKLRSLKELSNETKNLMEGVSSREEKDG